MNKLVQRQTIHPNDYADVEAQLREIFFKILFEPVIKLLAPRNAQVKKAVKELKNTKGRWNDKADPIVAGINSGKIQYVDGVFSGDFDASTSRALRSYGASWNKRLKTFTILPEALPDEVVAVAYERASWDQKLHARLMEIFNYMQETLATKIDEYPIRSAKVISRMDGKFDKSYGDALGTEGLSEHAKKILDKRYSNNLKPYIKKFSDEMILDLRKMVRANAETGYRFDNLIKRIEGRYDVTQSKAEFLARNETARFTAEHRQQRFGDVGITKYIWRTAGDSEVREDHKHLNGREFEYANPPVVDHATGRKANPGKDYNCRCIDEPVLPSILTEKEYAVS